MNDDFIDDTITALEKINKILTTVVKNEQKFIDMMTSLESRLTHLEKFAGIRK